MGLRSKLREIKNKRKDKKKEPAEQKDNDLNSGSTNKGLGLSKIKTTRAPPEFNDNKSTPLTKNLEDNNENKETSVSALDSIKRSLNDSSSELKFPNRTENNETSNSNKAPLFTNKLRQLEEEKKLNNETESSNKPPLLRNKSRDLQVDRELEVFKMKLEDTNMIKEGMKRFSNISFIDYSDPNQETAHKNYIEKQKNMDIHEKVNKYFPTDERPVGLYIESVDTVFDESGNCLSRSGSVRYLGKAEFYPARLEAVNELNNNTKYTTMEINKENENEKAHDKKPSNLPISINTSEEIALIKEIEKFEKKQINESKKYKPGKYFYNGKQIYPSVNFSEQTTQFSYKNASIIAEKHVNKSKPQVKKPNEEIGKMIINDLLLDFKNNPEFYQRKFK